MNDELQMMDCAMPASFNDFLGVLGKG